MKRGHSLKPRKRSGQLPLPLASEHVYVLDSLSGIWGDMFDVYADTIRAGNYMGIPRIPENTPFPLFNGSTMTFHDASGIVRGDQ